MIAKFLGVFLSIWLANSAAFAISCSYALSKDSHGTLVVTLSDLTQFFDVEKLRSEIGDQEFQMKSSSTVVYDYLPKQKIVTAEQMQSADVALVNSITARMSDQDAVDKAFEIAYKKYQEASAQRPKKFPPLTREKYAEVSGFKFGVEYATWSLTTDKGQTFEGQVYSSGEPTAVQTRLYADAIQNSIPAGSRLARLKIFHTHPRRSPLSQPDLEMGIAIAGMFGYQGLISENFKMDIWAVAVLENNRWIAYQAESMTDASKLPILDDEE